MISAIISGWQRISPKTFLAREAIYAARAAGLNTFRESLPSFEMELRRARRYERPLALLTIRPEQPVALHERIGKNGDAIVQLVPRPLSTHLVFFLLGSFLRESVRETDLVSYSAKRNLYVVLLPESDAVQAGLAAERISRLVYDRASIHLRAGVAEFPLHGLTLEDLVAHAEKAWQDQVLIGQLPRVRDGSNA